MRTFDGTVSIAQPLIQPLFGGRSTSEILSLLLGEKKEGLEIVRETAEADYLKGRFTDWNWKKALFDGVVADSSYKVEAAGRNQANENGVIGALVKMPKGTGYELALYAGAAHDGRYANNGWLVEMPDAMSRVSWENPLIVSPKTAEKLGNLRSDDVVLVKTAANTTGIEAAVYVMPGHADDALSLAVGYGRKGIGSVADGTGVDLTPIRFVPRGRTTDCSGGDNVED